MTIQQVILGMESALGFTFVASSTATNGNSVTIHASAQVGDIVILVDNIDSVSATPTQPSGWNLISAAFQSGPNIGVVNAYKILTESDLNTTVTSTNATTTNHFMLLAVFRPHYFSRIRQTTIGDSEIQATTNNPPSQTLDPSASLAPLITFFSMCQRGSNNVALTGIVAPTNDGKIDCLDESSRIVIRLYYKIYNLGTTPASTSGDIGDNGGQCLSSWFLKFT